MASKAPSDISLRLDAGRISARRDAWLAVARAAWLIVTVLTVALFLAAVPQRFEQLQRICTGIACTELQVTADDIRVLQGLGLSVRFYAAFNLTLEIVFALVHVVVALFIFVRRSNDRMALFVSVMLITFGAATFTGTLNALGPRPWAWRQPLGFLSALPDVLPGWLAEPASSLWFPAILVSALGQACIALFFYLFPNGRFVPRWTVVLALLWVGWQVPMMFLPASDFNPEYWPPLLAGLTWSVFLGSFAFAQLFRYRYVSDPVQRQQTKWVLYGVTIGLVGFIGAILVSGILFALDLSNLLARMAIISVMYVCMLAVPLSVGLAITRSRLWDIDVLINRALVYGLLSGTLALVYFSLILLLQTFLQPWIGRGQDDALLVLTTLATAALFTPVRRGAQRLIDRRFYRSKYDAARTLASFAATLRQEVELEKLSTDLLAVVEQAMQPTHVSLWLRRSERDE